MIANRQCNCLSVFRETTADEITKIAGRAPAKHCSLNPAPITSLVKRLMPLGLLAGRPTLAEMVNASLREGIFPNALKHAIATTEETVAWSWYDVNLYRPISNLSFVLKMVERVVVNRFDEHVETQYVLPYRQSTESSTPLRQSSFRPYTHSVSWF